MSRKHKKSPPIKLSNSAALAPKKAELLPRGGGPIDLPTWAPDGVDLDEMPESMRRAVVEVIEPVYQEMVVEVEDPLERSVGIAVVHLMWLEVLNYHEAMHKYAKRGKLGLRRDLSQMIDQQLRILNAQVKVANFLVRLRGMRPRAEAWVRRHCVFEVPCHVSEAPDDRDETEVGSWEMEARGWGTRPGERSGHG